MTAPGTPPRTLADLGLEPDDHVVLERAIQAPLGLVVVLGPRGSGLSTTLAAIVHARTAGARPLSAASPAVLVLDPPDAPAALRRAISSMPVGRQVFATLALERAAHVFGHLRAQGLAPGLLARDLLLAMAQVLVPALCPACRLPDTSAEMRRVVALAVNSWLAEAACTPHGPRPGGCAHCAGTGYAGRALAYELMPVDSGVRAMAEQGQVGVEMEQALFADGRSLWDQGLRLVARGTCALADLRAAVREPC